MESRPTNRGILILDIPVIHKGYVDLLKAHVDRNDVEELFLVGEDILEALEIRKEIRANTPAITRKLLSGLELPFSVGILNLDGIGELVSRRIYTARDDISRRLQEKFFPNSRLTQESVFLRWDESNVTQSLPANFDGETKDFFHIRMMNRARELANNSSDWWRRVGVVAVKDEQIVLEAYNLALPTDHKPYVDGNPRDFIKAGTLQFLSSTVHAEQAIIAKARGINLEGTDPYLNSYPCPPCATSMGLAGIRRCFSAGGNAYLDAAEVLKKVGIETIFVNDGIVN
jgi:deoxycytidylate deaminase